MEVDADGADGADGELLLDDVPPAIGLLLWSPPVLDVLASLLSSCRRGCEEHEEYTENDVSMAQHAHLRGFCWDDVIIVAGRKMGSEQGGGLWGHATWAGTAR